MAETQQNVVLLAAKNLSEGIPPSNVQIEESLNTAKIAIEDQQRSAVLDAQTEIIAQDLKAVINDTQRLLEEKNRDEKMQRFLLEAKLAAEEIARKDFDEGKVKKEAKKAGKELRPLQDEALEVLQMAKSLIYEIMRSGEFRRTLVNSIELFQQVFWDQVQEKGKPITDNLKADIERGDSNLSGTREAAREAGQRSEQQARQGDLGSLSGEQKKQELKRRFNQLLREIGEKPEYNQAVSDLFKLSDKLRSRIEKAAKNAKGAAKEVESVHITRMWEEGQKIIEEFTGHKRIQHILDALRDILDFIREDERAQTFFADLKKYVVEGLEHPERLQIDTTLSTQSFSATTTTSQFSYSSTQTTTQSGDATPKDAYDKLYEEGRELFKSEELKKRVNKLIDELHEMIRTARRDPASERLVESTRALMRDLTIDTTTGKPSLWTLRDNIEKSGRSILLPVLLRELEVVPVKGIRGSTKSTEYSIRNLCFSAYDLLPERARFYMDLDVDVDLSDIKRDAYRYAENDVKPDLEFAESRDADVNGEVVLRLDKIKTHVRDVEFHYLRKTFPQIEDWGRMDVDTQDNGCRLEVRWKIVSPRGGSAPTVVGYKTYCHIDGLTVTIRHAANHELLDKMMAKMFAGTVKERVERELERSLASFAQRVSALFNDIFAGKMPKIIPQSLTTALPALGL